MSFTLTRKPILIPDIGTIYIVKSRLNRRISIRVTAKHVRVSIPYRVSFNEGENFLFKNIEWVRNKYNELKFQFKVYDKQIIKTLFGDIHIHIKSEKGSKFACTRGAGRIDCYFFNEAHHNVSELYRQQKILHLIKHESQQYLIHRTAWLAEQFALKYTRVRLSSALSRWGSCSAKNSISLNYRLVFLPQHLCDYVILHELAHTVYKNHSKTYWAFLSTMVPDYEMRRRELKKYRFSDMP